MELLFAIGILLLFAKIFGYISQKVGLPILVGEVVAGILLGITGIVSGFPQTFIDLSMIFLMFVLGLSVKYDEIKPNIYKGSAIAIGGGLLSAILGFAVGMLFTNNYLISIVIGVIFVNTSDAVTFMLVKGYKSIKNLAVTATIADDILGIISLSVFTLLVSDKVAFVGIEKIIFVAIGFYLFLLTAGAKFLTFVLNLFSRFHSEHIFLTISIAIFFILSVIADNIGLGIAAGAFLAGMAITNTKYTENIIQPNISPVANGFFVPIFFASAGTFISIKELNILMVFGLLLAAVLGKFIGCSVVSKLLGERPSDSKLIGLMMIPRGDFSIAVTQIALGLGVITVGLYSSLISSIIITIILASVLVKLFR